MAIVKMILSDEAPSYIDKAALLAAEDAREGLIVSVDTEPGNLYIRNSSNTKWIPDNNNTYTNSNDFPSIDDFDIMLFQTIRDNVLDVPYKFKKVVPTYTAKSVQFRFNNNYGDVEYTGIRHISFYLNGIKIPYDASWVCDATTEASYMYYGSFAFDDSTNIDGSANASWMSGSFNITNQCLTVTFPEAITFDNIKYVNYHFNVNETDRSVKSTEIRISPTTGFTTVWAETVSDSVSIYTGDFEEHPEANTENLTEVDISAKAWVSVPEADSSMIFGEGPISPIDERGDVTNKYIDLTALKVYTKKQEAPVFYAKSVQFRCATNHGSTSHIGMRSVEFFKDDIQIPYSDTWLCDATTRSQDECEAKYTFMDTPLVDDGLESQWKSSYHNDENQILTVTFPEAIAFDEIRIVNCNSTGSYTDQGVLDLTIMLNTTDSFTTAWLDTLAGSYEFKTVTLVEFDNNDPTATQNIQILNDVAWVKNPETNPVSLVGVSETPPDGTDLPVGSTYYQI